MTTTSGKNSPAYVLFGKTRRSVLGLLYGRPDDSFYLRQVARTVGIASGTVQRELRPLVHAGIVLRVRQGHQVYFQANRGCPVFLELRGLVVKTVTVGEVVQAALAPLRGRILLAFVYGSFARGAQQRGSDMDVLIVGNVRFGEAVAALARAQEKLGREVNPTVYSVGEFRTRLSAGQHFLVSVLKGPKIFLIGGERELAGLAAQRVAR